MNRMKNLTLALALCAAGAAVAATPNAPDILVPNETNASVIKGMSDNGKYGVASSSPGEDGFSYYIGAHFYDLTGTTPKVTNLAKNSSAADAMDVTDDGLMVVGSVDHQPAVCRNINGTWTWEKLPVPNITYEVEMEDMYSGQITVQKFRLNGGQINAVTPDGRYGVGLCRSNENINIEKATMWDLQTKEIIETGAPETCLFGHDNDYNTRYQQISADGRYILCCNVFIYPDETVYFVYDRQEKKPIYIDYRLTAGGNLTKRDRSVTNIELDGISKSLTSDGRYVTGRAVKNDTNYAFIFDVKNEEFKILDDGIHGDVWGWSVTKDGLVLGGTPADTPYADALICTPDYFYTFESLYRDVYGLNMLLYGIDNTGKPTLVSDDGKTVVFVTEKYKSYVARFKESISDAVDRINLMSSWSANPKAGSAMAKFTGLTLTFENPIDLDASKYADIKFTDSKGNVSVSPKADGVNVSGVRLTLDFNPVDLTEGETYTLTVPAAFCWVKGHPNSTNDEIKVTYKGRANVPVEVKSISPKTGSTLANLDLNDNPVIVTFDAPVRINGTADSRPTAQLFVDGGDEPAASLAMDVDLNTNNLVIYPTSTIYLYKGSEYTVKVPEGAVTDISGCGPSKAFEVTYSGSFVPQLGDEKYLFKSTCDDFTNFLFYEGDNGTPTTEYQNMGFTYNTTPWWVVMDEGVEDMAFASHSVYIDGRASNDWVATRQIAMPEDIPAYLTFQGQSYRKYKTDRLKVYIYENEQSISQLDSKNTKEIVEKGDLVFNEVLSPGANEGIMAGEWTDYLIDLTPYKGKKIYICFVNDNRNESMVMIDNIFVVKDVNAFISIKSNTNVVNKATAPVSGIISVESELVDYKNLSMSLLDSEGKEVSSIKDNVNLTAGDTYNFTFPQELPLVVGEENPYTIVYTLDEDEMKYEGVIRNLSFQTEKRVVLEEQTGKDCQFCPLGLAAIERLESLYGSKLIPVALHSYSGSDPKGANILAYANTVFMGNGSAPMGRINRRPDIVSPMATGADGKYTMTASSLAPGSQNLWQDEVVAEFNEPSFLDVAITANPHESKNEINYTVTVKSALNLKDQNIRVLGVLLEDDLLDRQTSGVFNNSDPLLGEFGEGGLYGNSSFYYMFNNVARGYWGQSANGTPRLIPNDLENGKVYNVDMTYVIPGIVSNKENIKMVVMLIDENTGRVINAAVEKADISGVEEIIGETGTSLEISKIGSDVHVACPGDVQVVVYSLDGRVLRNVSAAGNVSLSLDGYKGVAIIKAAGAGQSKTVKVVF